MISSLQQPIYLKEDTYQPGVVKRISENEIYLTIQEGKFHQVKRMLHHVGNEVKFLKRVTFGNLTLDETLKPGEYRELSDDEIELIGGQL